MNIDVDCHTNTIRHRTQVITLLSKVLSFTKFSSASLTSDKSFLAAVTIETMTSWRMASSGSCDLTLKNSGKRTQEQTSGK